MGVGFVVAVGFQVAFSMCIYYSYFQRMYLPILMLWFAYLCTYDKRKIRDIGLAIIFSALICIQGFHIVAYNLLNSDKVWTGIN